MKTWAMHLVVFVVWCAASCATNAAEREVHCPKSWPEGSKNVSIDASIYDHDAPSETRDVIRVGGREITPVRSNAPDIFCQYKDGSVLILPLLYHKNLDCIYSIYNPKNKPAKSYPDLERKYLDAMCKIPADYVGSLQFSQTFKMTDEVDIIGTRLDYDYKKVEDVLRGQGIYYKIVNNYIMAHLSSGRNFMARFSGGGCVDSIFLSASGKTDNIFIEMKRKFGVPFEMDCYDKDNPIYSGNPCMGWQTDSGVTLMIREKNFREEGSLQTLILVRQPVYPGR